MCVKVIRWGNSILYSFKLSDNLNLVALNFDAFSFNDFKNFRKIAEFTKF